MRAGKRPLLSRRIMAGMRNAAPMRRKMIELAIPARPLPRMSFWIAIERIPVQGEREDFHLRTLGVGGQHQRWIK